MIDTPVDTTEQYKLMIFLDAYCRYNWILMHPDYQENTLFMTKRGIYCYKVMPIRLKNVGAT